MQLRNIVIDQGNSSFKIGVFEGKELMDVVEYEKRKDVIAFVLGYKPDQVLLSSVVKKSKKLVKAISETIKVEMLSNKTALPFRNSYATPETLGPDRIAAVAATHDLFKGENCLVIDAGTCITYDIIDNNGVYHGGAISPGVTMRFKALHHFTSKLPLLNKVDSAKLTGNSTKRSMESGVVNGVIAEANGMIEQYSQNYEALKVVLCGGDSKFFESKLKGHIFAVANLVLIGLNRILLFNIDSFEGIH